MKQPQNEKSLISAFVAIVQHKNYCSILHFFGDFNHCVLPQQILLLVSFLEFLSRQRPCQLPLIENLSSFVVLLVIGSRVLVDHFSNGLGLLGIQISFSGILMAFGLQNLKIFCLLLKRMYFENICRKYVYLGDEKMTGR